MTCARSNSGADWFYHRGMAAGENTLEGTITRLITRNLVARGSYDHDAILDDYIRLMTTPGSHNDTCEHERKSERKRGGGGGGERK